MRDKRDIYDMFNDVDIDVTEFEETPADELERQRVKNAVRRKIEGEANMKETGMRENSSDRRDRTGGRKNRGIKTAAACAMALVIGVTGFGLALPTYAREVPVVGDVFRYLDDGRTGRYDHYKESASNIDMTKENGDLRVTLNEGVYDGTTLYLTYTIQTEKDFGEHPIIETSMGFDWSLGIRGWGGSNTLRKAEDGVYVGMETITVDRDAAEGLETVPFTWIVEKMYNVEQDGAQGETAKCGFHFNVALSAIGGDVVQVGMKGTEPEKDIDITLEKLIMTDINTVLHYSMTIGEAVSGNERVEWNITDDKGNAYEIDDLGGSGKKADGVWNKELMISFNTPDPDAEKLIITPVIYYAETDDKGERIWNNDKGYPLDSGSFEISLK